MAGVTDFLSSLASSQFEKARAKLQSLVGRFFTYRDVLLNLKDRTDYLARKAEKTGNAGLGTAVTQLKPQLDAAYGNQVNLEGQVESVLSQVSAIQAGSSSTGASLGSMGAVASSLVSVAAKVAAHEGTVNGLQNLVKTLENKSLSPQEAAQVRSGSFGTALTASSVALLAGLAAVGIWFFKGRKK